MKFFSCKANSRCARVFLWCACVGLFVLPVTSVAANPAPVELTTLFTDQTVPWDASQIMHPRAY